MLKNAAFFLFSGQRCGERLCAYHMHPFSGFAYNGIGRAGIALGHKDYKR